MPQVVGGFSVGSPLKELILLDSLEIPSFEHSADTYCKRDRCICPVISCPRVV